MLSKLNPLYLYDGEIICNKVVLSYRYNLIDGAFFSRISPVFNVRTSVFFVHFSHQIFPNVCSISSPKIGCRGGSFFLKMRCGYCVLAYLFNE